MVRVAEIWENLFYGITKQSPLPPSYNTIKTWQIGDKIIEGQVYNQKILKNGNIQKRIITLFRDTKLGFETEVYSPDGELLKAYNGIRTTKGTQQIKPHNIGLTAEEMYASKNIKDAKTLSDLNS